MKKALHIIKTIVTGLVLLVAVGMMLFTLISVRTFDNKDRGIFGYKAFIVLSDSMSPDYFNSGDLVLSKAVDPKTLQEGDVITFQSTNPDETYGSFITHRIRRVTTDADGNLAFVTYGTHTGVDDQNMVVENFVIGKYQARLRGVGWFFQFLKMPQGYIICILVPFLILIMMQGINSIRLFKRYKYEQVQEMNEEKKKIEQERKEAQKMMEELLALKAQLAGKETVAEGAPQTPAPEEETAQKPSPEGEAPQEPAAEDETSQIT